MISVETSFMIFKDQMQKNFPNYNEYTQIGIPERINKEAIMRRNFSVLERLNLLN